jgi:hypothetical protein
LIGSNGSIDLTGGTINGEGMLTIYPGVALGTEGAIDVATTFGYHSGLGPDPVIPARLFGGDVTLITGAGSSPGGTGRIAAGTLTINGNLYLQANSDDPVILLLDGAANNPTVNISGDIAYTGAAASTESISMGNGTWTVGGDVDFTGGTVTAGGSTLKLNGSSGQTVTSNGQSLNAITITNASAGGVTFADRLQCATLTDTTNGSTIKFSAASAGARHTVSNTLTMTGGSGSDMITLAPQTPATVWYFSPPFGTTVTGVSVCYSNSDKTITANSSTNGGNNTNWVFGGAPPTPPTPKFDWQELAQVLTENELGLYQVYFLRYDLFSGTFLPDPRFTISPEFLESLVRK